MRQAYLCVETHIEQPDKVRFLLLDVAPGKPDPEETGPRIRFCARFNDGEAALMHAHERLKRRLVDIDAHIYRASCEEAIAAVSASDLRHSVAFIDPMLAESSLQEVARRVARLNRQQSVRNRFFEVMGYIGLGLLLLNMLVLSGH